jgi:5-methylthioadenosine/S-adenosylhomocysteine deaminase
MELWSAERVCIKGRFERDWGLLVDEQGTIQAIGPRQQLVAKAAVVNHYTDSLLMPAFVDAHAHSFARVFRGLADFTASFDDLRDNLIWPLSHAIDEELLEAVLTVSYAEQALSGVASIGEFFYLHNGNSKDSNQAHLAEKAASIASQLGLRITLVYTLFDQGTEENVKAFYQPLETSLKHYQALQEQYADNDLVNIIPGVHSLEHASEDAIKAAFKIAEEQNCKVHVQLAESERDVAYSRQQYGMSPLEVIDSLGLLNEHLVIVNGIHLTDEELTKMREHEIEMVICPSASLARASDFPNAYGLLREGIDFALGSGSLAMSNQFSLPEEIKWLEFSQRGMQKSLNILGSQTEQSSLWDLCSASGSRSLGLPDSPLMPGASADFMVVKLAEPAFKPNFGYKHQHFMNQLLFGWGTLTQVTHLFVKGAPVVRNGRLRQDISGSFDKIERWSEAFLRFMEKSTNSEEPPAEDEPSIDDTAG